MTQKTAASYKPTEALFYGSGLVDLLEFRVENVDFYWIADRLSKIPRFLGGTLEPYSIAQHSVWVSDNVAKEARPWALLHDAREAYIGDFLRPVVRTLDALLAAEGQFRAGDRPVSGAIEKLGAKIDARIYQAAGLPRAPTRQVAQSVATADNYALDVELSALVRGEQRMGAPRPVSAQRARDEFLNALKLLCPNARGIK